ncbi:MAG TPA: ribonuclease HII, partial [Rhodospirillaceae bacterium]|nr:ribonuclease HII [Rhodospirillaceae bacterium]
MPNLYIEMTCSGVVAGVDEAGRGPWAGPIVAA